MSLREEDYQWFTGSDNPLQFPWYDHEAITFKDPQRPSTELIADDEPDGPSFGPDADGPPGPKPPGPPGPTSPSGHPSPEDLSDSSGSATTDGGPTPFNAPPFEGPTPFISGKVDVDFKCQGRIMGHSVPTNIKEGEIQRLVSDMLQLDLDGYCVATVVEGMGRIGALVSGSTVELTPATAAQIKSVVQARTSATTDPKQQGGADTRDLRPGSTSPNWLAIQASREKRVDWDKFAAGLERDKMVHIITDGGARPNPGAAGWGVLMRQSGRYTQNWGHWDMASNNAIEILAVTEALANIPDGMNVWIMTDSAYVKNGITQLVSNWMRNGWNNSSGAQVANKSLWERLIAAVNRMRSCRFGLLYRLGVSRQPDTLWRFREPCRPEGFRCYSLTHCFCLGEF
jgi:ribonuclease HI